MLKVPPTHPVVFATKGFGIAIVLALLTCPIVVGCQNPKAANNRNFAKAITAYYGENSFCINDTMDEQFRASYVLQYNTGTGYSPQTELDKLLVRAGLLTLVSQNIVADPNGGASQMLFQFALTPLGREFYKKSTKFGMNHTGFCYGNPVVQVVDFTDPGPQGTSSRATFNYRLHGVPTWLTGELAQEFRNVVAAAVYADVQGTAYMTLMGSGWKVERVE